MSYWDINQFLAEEETVQFSFKKDAPGFQFLDSSISSQQIVPAQQPLHAPLWIVSTLYNYLVQQQEELVVVKMPEYLDSTCLFNFIQSLSHKASRITTQVANLRDKSLYFYQTYPKFIKLGNEEQSKLSKKYMKKLLENRGYSILDRARTHPGGQKIQKKKNKYTELQDQMYELAKQKTFEYNDWKYKTYSLGKK